jgi:hypothetical protein
LNSLDSTATAHFSVLNEVFQREKGSSAQIAYTLSQMGLAPTSMERTNVSLAAIFHESSIEAAVRFYDLVVETDEYIAIFRLLWTIWNTKSKYK